ncbi:MAG: hypothetical protein ACPGEC_06395 [Flavobacteriales bacterium]
MSSIFENIKKLFFDIKDEVDLANDKNQYDSIIELLIEEFKAKKKKIGSNLIFNSIFNVNVPISTEKELQPVWSIICETVINKIYKDLEHERSQNKLDLRPIHKHLHFFLGSSNDDSIEIKSFSFDESTPNETKASGSQNIITTITSSGQIKSILNYNDLIQYTLENGTVSKNSVSVAFDLNLKPVRLRDAVSHLMKEEGPITQIPDRKIASFSYTDIDGNAQVSFMTRAHIMVGSANKSDRNFLKIKMKNIEALHFKFRLNTASKTFEIACKEALKYRNRVLPFDEFEDLWYAFDSDEIQLDFGNKITHPLIIKKCKPE